MIITDQYKGRTGQYITQGLHTTLDSKENKNRSYPQEGAASLGNMASFYGLVDKIH